MWTVGWAHSSEVWSRVLRLFSCCSWSVWAQNRPANRWAGSAASGRAQIQECRHYKGKTLVSSGGRFFVKLSKKVAVLVDTLCTYKFWRFFRSISMPAFILTFFNLKKDSKLDSRILRVSRFSTYVLTALKVLSVTVTGRQLLSNVWIIWLSRLTPRVFDLAKLCRLTWSNGNSRSLAFSWVLWCRLMSDLVAPRYGQGSSSLYKES